MQDKVALIVTSDFWQNLMVYNNLSLNISEPHHPVMNRCKSLLKPILLDVLKKKKAWQTTKTRTEPAEKIMNDSEIYPVSSLIFYMEHQIPVIKTETFIYK